MIWLLALLPLLAQGAEPQLDCEDPQYQQEINICAAREYDEADAALNAQWDITSATMKQWDAEHGYDDGRPGYFDTLLAAQRAWIAFRDAHCASEGYLFRGGSAEPMVVSGCKAGLTRERTLQLRALVEFDG